MKNYRTLHALLSAFLAVILLVSSFSVGVTAIGNSDWNPNDWNWDEHDGWWQLSDAAGWEISPIFAHRNAAKQTVRRP